MENSNLSKEEKKAALMNKYGESDLNGLKDLINKDLKNTTSPVAEVVKTAKTDEIPVIVNYVNGTSILLSDECIKQLKYLSKLFKTPVTRIIDQIIEL